MSLIHPFLYVNIYEIRLFYTHLVVLQHGCKRKKQPGEGMKYMPGKMVAEGNLPSSLPISEVSESGQSTELGMIVTEEQEKPPKVCHYVTSKDIISSTSGTKYQKCYHVPENNPPTEMSLRTCAVPDKDEQETFFYKAEQEG